MDIRLGHMYYKVVDTEKDIIVNAQLCKGCIEYDNHIIRMSLKENDEQDYITTLFHEVVHGLLHEHKRDDLNTEENVEDIAQALYQLAIDNPFLFEAEEVKEDTDITCKPKKKKSSTKKK